MKHVFTGDSINRQNRFRLVYILCFFTLRVASCHTLRETADHSRRGSRPNVVYILADDLGYGDGRSFNPQGLIPTPNIDRLASEGMQFTDAHSASAVCTPSRYSFLTGKYLWHSDLQKGVLYGYSHPLIESGRLTAAELYQQNGYYTACVGKWHLGMDWAIKPGNAKIKTVWDADYGMPIQCRLVKRKMLINRHFWGKSSLTGIVI